jgi:hypothetical protein
MKPIPEYQNLKVNVGKIPAPITYSVLKTHFRWLKVSFAGHTTFLQKTHTYSIISKILHMDRIRNVSLELEISTSKT